MTMKGTRTDKKKSEAQLGSYLLGYLREIVPFCTKRHIIWLFTYQEITIFAAGQTKKIDFLNFLLWYTGLCLQFLKFERTVAKWFISLNLAQGNLRAIPIWE